MHLLLTLIGTALATAPPSTGAFVCAPTFQDPACTHDTLTSALVAGETTITLSPGRHVGSVTLSAPGTQLWGQPGAVIEGGSADTLLTIDAPDVLIVGMQLDARPGRSNPYVAVHAKPAATQLELRDVEISDADTPGEGAVWVQGDLLCTRCDFHDNDAVEGAAVFVDVLASVELVDSTFDRNNAVRGGAVYAVLGNVTVSSCTFDDSEALSEGGHFYVEEGTLTIDDTELTWGEADAGGAVWAGYGATVTVQDTFASHNRAWEIGEGAGLHLFQTGVVSIEGSWFDDHQGVAVRARGGASVQVTDTVFDANRADGALWVNNTAGLEIDRSWFCDNQGTVGAAVRVQDACASGCSVTNSVFEDNHSDDTGGALRFQGPIHGALKLEHLSLARNRANTGGAISLGADLPALNLLGVLAWDNRSLLGGPVIGAGAPVNPLVQPAEVFGWDNSESTMQLDLGTATLVAPDPPLHDTWQPCGSQPALLDCTDPAVAALLDLIDDDGDGDGFVGMCECDDTDAAVHPGTTEVPHDGIDQDCDGQEICYLDADLDGYGSSTEALGPVSCRGPGVADNDLDCDDDDPFRYPGGPQDCDGMPTEPTDTGSYSDPYSDPTTPRPPLEDDVAPLTWLAGGASCRCTAAASPEGPWRLARLIARRRARR